MTEREHFDKWWRSSPHRTKYSVDHPAYLAGWEAWQARATLTEPIETRSQRRRANGFKPRPNPRAPEK